MRNLIVLAALAALCHCRSDAPKAADAKAPTEAGWFEIQTEHVRLFTDAGEVEGREVASQCERLRAALIAGSWSSAQTPLREVRVIALADRQDFLRRIPLPNFDGWAVTGLDGGGVLIVHGGRDPAEDSTLKHELAHALNREFMLRQPRWFSEGLAEYLETLRIARGGGAMILGEPSADIRGYLQRYPKLDFAKVMRTGPEVIAAKREDVMDFYAQSWLLTYVLMNRHRAQLGQFVHRLARAEDPKAAFAAAFPGVAIEDLEREGAASFRPGQPITMVEVPLPPLGTASQARKLASAEARVIDAELDIYSARILRRPERLKRPLEEMRAVLAEDPTNLRAGLVAYTASRDRQERLAVARQLAAKNPQQGLGHRLLAEALGAVRGPAAERRAALEKAVELSHDDASALNGLAWNDLLTGRFPEALPLAIRAAKLRPADPGILDTLALALDVGGQCAQATQVQERALELLPDRAAPVVVARFRSRLAAYRTRCEHPSDDEARRIACSGELGPGAAASVKYVVRSNGLADDVEVAAPEDRAAEVKNWLADCLHQPRLRGGNSVAAIIEEHLAEVPGPQAALRP
jgi:tetratricopeptide (TPR) repeat protein